MLAESISAGTAAGTEPAEQDAQMHDVADNAATPQLASTPTEVAGWLEPELWHQAHIKMQELLLQHLPSDGFPAAKPHSVHRLCDIVN